MKKSLSSLIVVVVIGLIGVIVLSNSIFYTLQPGECAIVFRKFGTGLDKENVLRAGFHVIAPWNAVYSYDVRELIYDMVDSKEDAQTADASGAAMDVLDKNGLLIHVEATVRYHPVVERIGYLHEEIGINYREKLVIPEMRSMVRNVMGRYTAEEIYSLKRGEVEQFIIKETAEIFAQNNIKMTALLIRSIKLPEEIKNAIESKLKQEQEAAAMKYRVDKELQEAERKRIEAEGISRFNQIINASLSAAILQQRGIEATIELAKSPNSKVVVIGGANGMPLILGNQ